MADIQVTYEERKDMATEHDNQTDNSHHIREDADGDRQFVLHPEDNDLFVRNGRQVIDGCRLTISVEVWIQECNAMFEVVLNWIRERPGRLHACYALPHGGGIGLFFVPQSESFDFDLAGELAELDSELVRSFNVGLVESHQVPFEELDRFIIREIAHEVYSDANRPHQAMAT